MTKNEFISLASKHGISVSELSGHLYLTVLDSEFEGWKCETNQYRDEVMKWLLSFHPHEVLLDFISDVVPEEETDAVALFVTDWLLRQTDPEDEEENPEFIQLLQTTFMNIIYTYDRIAYLAKDLYGMPVDDFDEDIFEDYEDDDDDDPEGDDMPIEPDNLEVRRVDGPYLGMNNIYGNSQIWDQDGHEWWPVDYSLKFPEMITEKALQNLRPYVHIDSPMMLGTEYTDVYKVFGMFADAIADDLADWIKELTFFCKCSAPKLLMVYPKVECNGFLVSEHTAKGKIRISIGEHTEEDTITFTIPEAYYRAEETDALYRLAESSEISRSEEDQVALGEEYFDFFAPKIREMAAEKLKDHLSH